MQATLCGKEINGINRFALKWIAILTMVTDHVGVVFFPHDIFFRMPGRIAFPLFIFMLVEGFSHTSDQKKYLIRLVIFAFLSEIPFDLAFSGKLVDIHDQNVFFTLALGLGMLCLIEHYHKLYIDLIILAACVAIAFGIHCDYSGGGILLIYLFYRFRYNNSIKVISFFLISLIFYNWLELFGLLAFIPIVLYNGKKGPSMKYLFYIFYPAHLLVLAILSMGGKLF